MSDVAHGPSVFARNVDVFVFFVQYRRIAAFEVVPISFSC
jgi:hypothetical protein